MISTMPMKQVYFICLSRWFPKLQTHNSGWFKESSGSCNCVVLFRHQELINGSCWLLGKGLSLGALVWTVYQFCTMLKKNVWMTSEIYKKWLKSWDMELQWKLRKIVLVLDNCAADLHLDFLKNIQLEFLSPNTNPRYSQWTWEP
jgi:hypothetical protein